MCIYIEKPTIVKVDVLIANFWTIEEANMVNMVKLTYCTRVMRYTIIQ